MRVITVFRQRCLPFQGAVPAVHLSYEVVVGVTGALVTVRKNTIVTSVEAARNFMLAIATSMAGY
jgi:hypothetical protein